MLVIIPPNPELEARVAAYDAEFEANLPPKGQRAMDIAIAEVEASARSHCERMNAERQPAIDAYARYGSGRLPEASTGYRLRPPLRQPSRV